MRLVSFHDGFGRIEGDDVVPMGSDIVTYLAGLTPPADGPRRPLAGLVLRPPVPKPSKIICVGLNYREHAAESGLPIPSEPVLFAKYPNSLAGPYADVIVPAACDAVDYEAELGIVIGSPAARISPAKALDCVAGYLCLNDFSDRDLQARGSQWTRGKAIDTFLPAGPWLSTSDEVVEPQNLSIRCLVNGEVRQSSSTSDMIFTIAEVVSFISATISLLPGDIIATGTPQGVGMGFSPPRYLSDGDEVIVEIEGLGQLRNTIRRETAVESPAGEQRGQVGQTPPKAGA